MAELNKGPKILMWSVVGAVFVGVLYANSDKIASMIPKPASVVSSVSEVVDLPKVTVGESVAQAPRQVEAVPGGGAVKAALAAPVSGRPCMKVLEIPWNAISSLNYANGGPRTTKGSIMDKKGVCLVLERQDDYDQMKAEQLKFAEAVAKGVKHPSEGANFVVIMGDGGPAYFDGLSAPLAKLNQAYKGVATAGFSFGEDKCVFARARMIDPKTGKVDPQRARGALAALVPRDGDQNICMKWGADNRIPVNADAKTYDPDAINFLETKDFVEAGQHYIAGTCETRPVVKNGLVTNEQRKVCVDGAATWTPEDVTMAEKKGGFVTVASTREYANQMPALLIGNDQWMRENRAFVEAMIEGVDEGARAINGSEQALLQAGAINAQIFKEQDAQYWATYFRGKVGTDATGQQVSLGGSRVVGLSGNEEFFGLKSGSLDVYKAVYTTFGNMNVKYYPSVMTSYPAYASIVDTSYLRAVLSRAAQKGTMVVEAKKEFTEAKPVLTEKVSTRDVTVEFDFGKATIRPESYPALNEMADQIAITGEYVRIDGHTDNVGSAEANMKLSRERGEAVKKYLKDLASDTFPDKRVAVRGYGPTQPVADNATEDGRAKNRRVMVSLGH